MAINETHDERHTVEMEADRIALCRCWKSKKFPDCDGSHKQYNIDNDDNTGPVIVVKDAGV